MAWAGILWLCLAGRLRPCFTAPLLTGQGATAYAGPARKPLKVTEQIDCHHRWLRTDPVSYLEVRGSGPW